MEPSIQYAKTEDGVHIAFWALGEGEALLHLPLLYSHIQREWDIPQCRQWYERLARRRTLVRYDPRNRGLSDRDASDISLEAQIRDLEAVADRLGLERFAVFGPALLAPLAIAYAAQHPERISGLVLWCPVARASDWVQSAVVQSVRALLDKDWEFYGQTAAHALLGWSAGEEARQFARLIRESVTQESLREAVRTTDEFDVAALLSEVRVPTLVLHRPVPQVGVGIARELASRIPAARLVLFEGDSLAPYLGDVEPVAGAIDEFLGEGEGAETPSEGLSADIVHTILFTDVEGSTALAERLGDAKARELLREHERIVREALKAHGGSEVKSMGDGFMTSFSSATKALECAIAIQSAFAERNESAEEPINASIGLNAGEPIAEGEDLFGTAVNMAARIMAKAAGGEILTSETVRGLVAGKGFLFSDRGDTELRGFEDLVRVYEVRWRE